MIRSLLHDPPLTPSPDDARSSLRRELLKPEYNDQNLVQRLHNDSKLPVEHVVLAEEAVT